jgi:hypothetical protein
MSKSKLLIAAAIALGATLGAGAVQARDYNDVQWSVTIGSPVGVPVYTAPRVVHAQPVYVHQQPVYVQPQPVYGHVREHRGYGQPTRWDRDGDGIPNRHDRRYNPRWDIDGDGVANRYDRDVDGDGVPNRYDRRDGRTGYGDNVTTRHHGYR